MSFINKISTFIHFEAFDNRKAILFKSLEAERVITIQLIGKTLL